MAVNYSPFGNSQIIDANGDPASGWKIYTYAAGSSTPLATYTSANGLTAQSNPIIINSLGFPTIGQIWLTEGLTYKLQLTDANDVVKDTQDNISGVNDSATTTSQWVSSGAAPTYISPTSFSLAGDQTTEFHVGRRLQFLVTAGTVYGIIRSSVFTTLTTVTVSLEQGSVLDTGLSSVNFSFLRADKSALPIVSGGTVVSASNTDLSVIQGHFTRITGTNAILSWTMVRGQVMNVEFDDILTLTYNATTNKLPSGANITTEAGDTATLYFDGTTTFVNDYQRFNVVSQAMAEAGTDTQPRMWSPERVGQASVIAGTRLLTAQTTTTGTSKTFAIPPNTKIFSVVMSKVSLSGTSNIGFQLGTAAGFQVTGYEGTRIFNASTSLNTTPGSVSSISFDNNGSGAGITHTGNMTFRKFEDASNKWSAAGMWTSVQSTFGGSATGEVTLSDAITQIRIFSLNGTDTFDLGSVNISIGG